MGFSFAALTLASTLSAASGPPAPVALTSTVAPPPPVTFRVVSFEEGVLEVERVLAALARSDEPLAPLALDDTLEVEPLDADPEVVALDEGYPPAFVGAAPLELALPFELLDGEPELPCPLHATMRALGRWLMVLFTLVFVAALLGSVGAARRPLPLALVAVRCPPRPIPVVERLLVFACLWSPMLMLLGLLQAEREMLSSVLLCLTATTALSAAAMFASRKRLQAQLTWAVQGRLDQLPDGGELVRAEVEPVRLVPIGPDAAGGAPPEEQPWYHGDLLVRTRGGADEPPAFARVSLDGAMVDEEAARLLLRVAQGLPASGKLTVLGAAERVPAAAESASPLERGAPTMLRVGGEGGALVVAGAPAALARQLRLEMFLVGGALIGALGAAVLTLQ